MAEENALTWAATYALGVVYWAWYEEYVSGVLLVLSIITYYCYWIVKEQ